MPLDGLADLPLHGVQLHVAGHTVLLGGDSHHQQPLQGLVCSVVDDLAAAEGGVAVKNLLGLRLAWEKGRKQHGKYVTRLGADGYFCNMLSLV